MMGQIAMYLDHRYHEGEWRRYLITHTISDTSFTFERVLTETVLRTGIATARMHQPCRRIISERGAWGGSATIGWFTARPILRMGVYFRFED
jgi:hypothetical protein